MFYFSHGFHLSFVCILIIYKEHLVHSKCLSDVIGYPILRNRILQNFIKLNHSVFLDSLTNLKYIFP